MDGKFVPNTTVGLDDLVDLPLGPRYEFHWMVESPEQWIVEVPGPHLHIPHIEAISSFEEIEEAAKRVGGMLGIAFNPETPPERVIFYDKRVSRLMAMTVHPGFAGQKYIREVEDSIRWLRMRNQTIDIEVDGGINIETIGLAVKAGANKLAAASAIFSAPDTGEAIRRLKLAAMAAAKELEANTWVHFQK